MDKYGAIEKITEIHTALWIIEFAGDEKESLSVRKDMISDLVMCAAAVRKYILEKVREEE